MNRKTAMLCAAALLAAFVVGCASKQQGSGDLAPLKKGATARGAGMSEKAFDSTIKDWSNRSMGQVSQPGWLVPLTLENNENAFRSAFNVDDSYRVLWSVGDDRNIENARIDSELFFAQKTANELKQHVLAAASRQANQGQVERLQEITAVTKVDMSGTARVTDFWQLVDTVEDGSKSRRYIYYTVYTIPKATWSLIGRKYVNDIIGKVPDMETKKLVAAAYGDIEPEINAERQWTADQRRLQLELQAQAAKNQQAQAMASINQQTAKNQAMSEVAKTQVQSEADARYAAYKYGDAAMVAEASTDADDFDWINAMNTAAKVAQ
jgi:hypothetical protein